MTQRMSRRRRVRVRSHPRLARCIPSHSNSLRSSNRRSNPFNSNRQQPSSTGRRKYRVLLSNRRRRRNPHGDTGWISSAAKRRPSGKTIKVSLSISGTPPPRCSLVLRKSPFSLRCSRYSILAIPILKEFANARVSLWQQIKTLKKATYIMDLAVI